MQEFRVNCTSTRERRTADETLRVQLTYIADRAITGARGRGWDYELGTITTSSTGKDNADRWVFGCAIRFYRKTDAAEDRFRSQRSLIAEWAGATGHNARFVSRPWICMMDGSDEDMAAVDQTVENDDTDTDNEMEEALTVTPLSEVGTIKRGRYYDHLFDLDSQVTILLSSVQAAIDSAMANRFHALLWGPPAAGKTEILIATSRLLQSLGVSFLSLDATSTTEAGMRKSLLDDDVIPPDVILIEEIEKVVSENSLRWLLGIMDDRATISQTNYRRTASRKVPALILATANDYEFLSKMMGGALLSRFSSEIYCPRPNRAALSRILLRDIKKIDGAREEWIEPTLTFMHDELGVTDPRKLRRVCLCGKDRLLDGSYQRDLTATARPSQAQKKPPGIDLEKI